MYFLKNTIFGENQKKNLTVRDVSKGICFLRNKAWAIVNVCITKSHIENDVPMQFEPRPIQFDMVKIVVQVGTGTGYYAFVLENKD